MPTVQREFRAAWVATVNNIDWPSAPGLSVAAQKREAVAILDRLVKLNMNAVVFQVRPQADALYASALEPWSYYLTGVQGKPPTPFYDPLEFWVRESHARGLELHAWFNPYRANHPSHKGGFSDKSIVKAHPDWIVELGSRGYSWMDPALQAVQDHSTAVVMDVVRRYDIDGVHFDDYFYPYSSYNDNHDFPDDKSWSAYRASGGKMSRADWRRAAVNRFIERVYREIKKAKPHVKFGISPFGIWRPGHPPGIQGFDQYNGLYADAKLWLNRGWVDYMTPQLYWPISRVPLSFPVLLGWWNRQNLQGRHVWPGTSLARIKPPCGATEIVNQIMIARGMAPGSPGICMFSMRRLMVDQNQLADALINGPYAQQALIPASPWLDATSPPRPAIEVTRSVDNVRISWSAAGAEPVAHWVVYYRNADGWSYKILPGHVHKIAIPTRQDAVRKVAVVAVDRAGNASKAGLSDGIAE